MGGSSATTGAVIGASVRAKVEFNDGTVYDVELHWYEAHGIGRREEKVKRVVRLGNKADRHGSEDNFGSLRWK